MATIEGQMPDNETIQVVVLNLLATLNLAQGKNSVVLLSPNGINQVLIDVQVEWGLSLVVT